MKLVEYSDREMLSIDVANVLVGDIVKSLTGGDYVTFVVPGGTTPGPIFDSLNSVDLDWGRVNIMLSDERWVPQASTRSNTRLLRERLFVNHASDAGYLPIYAESKDPEDVIDILARAIKPQLPVGILLLGMGDDMHTASLFPGAPQLAAALSPDAPILMAMDAPQNGEARVSLSAHVLNAALSKHIIITGDSKRVALENAQKIGDPMLAPVLSVLDSATVHWAP